MASGYSLTLMVAGSSWTPLSPGHVAVVVNTPEGSVYAGFGPSPQVPHLGTAVAAGLYNVELVPPGGQASVGTPQFPNYANTFGALNHPSFDSYSTPISSGQAADVIIKAYELAPMLRDYNAANPFSTLEFCTIAVKQLVDAAGLKIPVPWLPDDVRSVYEHWPDNATLQKDYALLGHGADTPHESLASLPPKPGEDSSILRTFITPMNQPASYQFPIPDEIKQLLDHISGAQRGVDTSSGAAWPNTASSDGVDSSSSLYAPSNYGLDLYSSLPSNHYYSYHSGNSDTSSVYFDPSSGQFDAAPPSAFSFGNLGAFDSFGPTPGFSSPFDHYPIYNSNSFDAPTITFPSFANPFDFNTPSFNLGFSLGGDFPTFDPFNWNSQQGYSFSPPTDLYLPDFGSSFTSSSSDYSSGFVYWGEGEPVVLDLAGDGINITPLSSSNIFYDMAGDGLQHRTAWAGAGDGVLVLDLDGSGQITQRNQVIFTDWDPTAANDMQALRDVFDTNQNGMLDAGDAQWASFKILVTNADGTTTLKTLAELGIQSIDLIPDSSTALLPDGSRIDGVTTFTRVDGTTGAAASTVFSYDSGGFAVDQNITHNPDGSTSIENVAYNSDGSVAQTLVSTTSADGLEVTVSHDQDGDGVFDAIQTRVTVINGDGSRIETITDTLASGIVVDKSIRTTTADADLIIIERDVDGNGINDRTEVYRTLADGSKTATIWNLDPNGSPLNGTMETTSADGLTNTRQTDIDGDGQYDKTHVDSTVINGDGSRVRTSSDYESDGTLTSRSITTISSDGRTAVTQDDRDGDELFDVITTNVINLNADGSTTATITETDRDGSLRDDRIISISADGLTKSTQSDADGDGVFELTTTDVTAVNTDGSRTETVANYTADGSLLNRSVTTWDSSGQFRTSERDTDGDGNLDSRDAVIPGADGTIVETVSLFNPDGSLNAKTVTTTTADRLVTIQAADVDGDDVVDSTTTTAIEIHVDGSSTTTVTALSRDGSLLNRAITDVSADGLSVVVTADETGDGITDNVTSKTITVNSDGSRTETTAVRYTDGSLQSQTVTTISADRKSTITTSDSNGDGAADQTQSSITQQDGRHTDTVTKQNPDGSLQSQVTTVTTADGLAVTTEQDRDGDGQSEIVQSDITVINADGSHTETVSRQGANASLLSKTESTVSANGFFSEDRADLNGDGIFDSTVTSRTTINADGSKVVVTTKTAADGTLVSRTVTATNASGLEISTQSDRDGSGTFDRVQTDLTTPNLDGSKVEIVSDANADGSLRTKTVTTTSADLQTTVTQSDTNGDGIFDQSVDTTLLGNGALVKTTTNTNPDGSLSKSTTTTVSADQNTKTTDTDQNGDGLVDNRSSSVLVHNADGSVSEDDSSLAGTTLVKQTHILTSADGRVITTTQDLDGNGIIDSTRSDSTVVQGDGVQIKTTVITNADGSLHSRSVQTTSPDGNTTDTIVDSNGDGIVDQSRSSLLQADGSVVDSISCLNTDGSTHSSRITTTSADGFSEIINYDDDGDGLFDETTTDVTVLNLDGSQTETFAAYQGSETGSIRYQVSTSTADNGLARTIDWNGHGGWDFLDRVISDVTTPNSDGSKIETISSSKNSELVIATTADGLSETKTLDLDGDGATDKLELKVENLDGSTSKTTTWYDLDTGAVQRQEVNSASADKRTSSLQRDSDGDGAFDHSETHVINEDGSTADTTADLDFFGLLIDTVSTITSADGLSTRTEVDSNGDGAADYTKTVSTVLNADGSQTETTERLGSNGALWDKIVTITSANALSKTTQTDTDGDGAFDQTRSDVTQVNGDGSDTNTVTERYADGSLKSQTTETTSADGTTKTIEIDQDGNGQIDREIVQVTAIDGSSTNTVRFFSPNGNVKSTITTSTDAAVSQQIIERSSGPEETTNFSSNMNGSYFWKQDVTVSGLSGKISSSHAIDELGVDTWKATKPTGVTLDEFGNPASIDYSTKSIRLDSAAKDQYRAAAERIYDVALDRGMGTSETELLPFNFNVAGVLEAVALAQQLLDSPEFNQRYGGSISNATFIDQIYQNAYGRAASLSELSDRLQQLASPGTGRADIIVAVAESAEHLWLGNAHTITNNTESGAKSYSFEHTTNEVVAQEQAKLLVDAALDRDATAAEIDLYSSQILSGQDKNAPIANALISSSEFAARYGTLTNSDFVNVVFMNAVGRMPTSQEAQYWASELSKISRADFLNAVAKSTDHVDEGTGHANTIVASATTTLPADADNLILTGAAAVNGTGNAHANIIVGNSSDNTLDGGAGADTLIGGSGNDTFLVDDGGDVVSENANEGYDVVQSSVSFTLPDNVEQLVLTGRLLAVQEMRSIT